MRPYEVRENSPRFYPRAGKRAFDVVVSTVGLVFLSPLFCVLAVAIKLSSREPVFFRQRRVGRDGIPFKILKFRSMRAGSEALGSGLTASSDPRITRLGRLLRRYKIDELPQLWNVLVGEMSLVGPRPELQIFVAGYTAAQRGVLAVRPGITGPDALAYRSEENLLDAASDPARFYRETILPEKLALGIQYAKEIQFFTDVKIILQSLQTAVFPSRDSVMTRHTPRRTQQFPSAEPNATE